MFGITTAFLLCAILEGLTIGITAQLAAVDPDCAEPPWNVTVSPELVVRWSGINRTGDVRIDIKAIDPPDGAKCIRKELVPMQFNDYELTLPLSKTPCKGTWYNVTATLICSNIDIEKYAFKVFVPPEALTSVENLRQVDVSDSWIQIEWDSLQIHGRLNISYSIRWYTIDVNTAEKDRTAVSSYTIQELDPYREYSIQVRAHSGEEAGSWSNVLVLRTDAGVPFAPQNVTSTSDSTSMNVTWEEPKPFRGPIILYTVIWRRYENSNLTRSYTGGNTSQLFFVVQDLLPLAAYYVRVSARTETKKGNWSEIELVRTKRPIAPEHLRPTAVTRTSIEVAWNEPSLYVGRGLITAYSVQWIKVNTNESQIKNTTETAFNLDNLYPFTIYLVQVRAWTENGFGKWSQPLEIETEIGEPDPPENLRRTAVSGRSIEVAWEEPSLYAGRDLIVAYSVQWIQVDSNDSHIANISQLRYKIGSLYPFTKYSVRVRAWTESGSGEWTQPLQVQTEIGVPDPPEDLREITITSRSIEVSWDEPSLYAGRGLISVYSVQWINLDTNENRTVNTTGTTYKMEDLHPFSQYSVGVRAWTADGFGDWTYIKSRTKIGVPWPPEKLRTAKITDTTIKVVWDVPKDYKFLVTRHYVRWKIDSKLIDQERVEETTKSEYVLQDLDPFTDYLIWVRSLTIDGAGNWTDPILVQTSIGVPSVPTNITFTDIQQTNMKVVWQEPVPYRGPITSFAVQWGAVNTNLTQRNVTTGMAYVLSELSPYTLYWIQVSASSYAGAGEWSPRLEARTAVGIPSVPRNLTETEATNTTIGIRWEEPIPSNGPITLYTVRWTNLNKEVVMNVTTKLRSYVIVNLDPFTNHSVEVRAITEAGSGDWSDSLIIRTDIGVPSEPTELEARRITHTSIELVWKEPEPSVGVIEHYVLQWNNTNTRQKSKIKLSTTHYTIKSLNPYTEYSIRVRAATSVGQGNWTEPRIFRTSSGVPGPPLDVRQAEVTNSSIDIQWQKPERFTGPITSYNVRWIHTTTDQLWIKSTNSTMLNLYTIEGLDPYTPYNITVRAKTEAGFGPWSDAITIRTAIGIPTVPRNIAMRNKTSWFIDIEWDSPDPANGPLIKYEVVWGVLGAQTDSNFTNETYFGADNLKPYTKYTFQVCAATEVGYGPQSQPLILRTDIAIPSEPVQLKLLSSTNTSVIVEWKEPEPSNGPILGYSIQWRRQAETEKFTNTTTFTTFSILYLDSYTNYTIEVSARTTAGSGPWTKPLVASTKIGVPKSALLRSIEVESSRSISVEWDTQGSCPGPADYSLEVWRKPGQCDDSKKDFRESFLKGSRAPEEWGIRRTEMVEKLTPYTQYYVRVVLKTIAGGSQSSNSTTVRTLPESPEAPTQVQADCKQSSTEAEVRWIPPVRANGKIIEYVVKYGVEHSGWNERIIAATSQCREHSILLKNLRPERKYRIYVQARTEGISKTGDEGYMGGYCVLPAGVPPMGNSRSVKTKGSGSFQLVFEWSRDVFNDTMGSLVNYAILVGESEAVGNATSGRSAELLPTWANFSAGMSSFYQATPLEWNPFEKVNDDPLNCEEFQTDDGVEIRIMTRCTVGVKSHCPSEENYCNGPLRPDTTYGLKIRAFTRGGFSETEPLYAKTGPAPGSSLAGGLVGGFLFLLVVSAFITGTFILKRKGKLEELRLVVLARFRPQPAVPQPPPEQVLNLEPYPTVKPLTAENFAEHVRIMMSDSHLRFSQEFEALKSNSPKFPCSTAEMQENRLKNRWLNIFPYDHSRVKLLPLGDDPESDFINANYIPGYSSLREYIACQGPLNGTVDDMWRMVWEQSSTMIVMLTQCVERGKSKCEQYWPSPPGESAHYGDIQVRTISESMLSSYVIRVFHLQLGSQERMVKQMHFTHWPDFGCPEHPDDLINFIRAVRDHMARIRPGPILVHCSAGVGRTGTFIAVDRLSQQLRYTDSIDIYGTVMELRHHRVNMVQTEDQYIYIHLCVLQLLDELNQPKENEYEEAIYSNVGMEKDTGV